MVNMDCLNEAELLQNLGRRYWENQVYTYIGKITTYGNKNLKWHNNNYRITKLIMFNSYQNNDRKNKKNIIYLFIIKIYLKALHFFS